jgi:hypothetical protein
VDPATRERRLLVAAAGAAVLGCAANVVAMGFAGTDPYAPGGEYNRGGDFAHFWAGAIVLERWGGEALYDQARFREALRIIFPPWALGYDAVYPPPVYQLCAPFAAVPYGTAARVFLVLMAELFALGAFLLVRAVPALDAPARRPLAIAFLAASPPLYMNAQVGQVAGLWFAMVAGGVLLLTRGRPLAAGALLGLLWAKPTLALVAGAALVLTGRRRALAGMVLGGAALFAVSISFGPDAWVAYAAALARLPRVLDDLFFPLRHATFRGLLSLWGAPAGVALWVGAGAGLVLAAAAARAARGAEARGERALLGLGATLSAAALAVPHLFEYDLWVHHVGLAAGAAHLLTGRARRPRLGIVLGSLAWWLPAFESSLMGGSGVGTLALAAWIGWMIAELAGDAPAASTVQPGDPPVFTGGV